MKIGIVLSSKPSYSETFFWNWLKVIEKNHQIVIYSDGRSGNKNFAEWRFYLNRFSRFYLIYHFFKRFKRSLTIFLSLKYKHNISTKILVHDLTIWTDKIDYLHFYFGNLVDGRFSYGEAMGVKWSVSFKGSDLFVYPIRHRINYERILLNCKKIQAESDQIKSTLVDRWNILPEYITVINPIVPNLFQVSSELVKMPLDLTKWKFISVGRLHWVKNYSSILWALSHFKKINVNFCYTIIGDGTELEELLFLIDKWDLSNNVEFKYVLSQEEIVKELSESHVFINFSWSEGFSNAIIEAQVLGLPTIVSPVSGSTDIILHKRTGYICENNEINDLLDGLKWITSLTMSEFNVLIDNSKKNGLRFCDKSQFEEKWLNFFD